MYGATRIVATKFLFPSIDSGTPRRGKISRWNFEYHCVTRKERRLRGTQTKFTAQKNRWNILWSMECTRVYTRATTTTRRCVTESTNDSSKPLLRRREIRATLPRPVEVAEWRETAAAGLMSCQWKLGPIACEPTTFNGSRKSAVRERRTAGKHGTYL